MKFQNFPNTKNATTRELIAIYTYNNILRKKYRVFINKVSQKAPLSFFDNRLATAYLLFPCFMAILVR